MADDLIEVRATVKGHVQGVGFRVTARQHAMRLGIVGSVRNLADGSVEVHAFGKRRAVEELLKVLKDPHGPGKVLTIFSEEISPVNKYDSFRIVP